MIGEKLVMALPKGRILREALPLLERAGVKCDPALADEDERALRFPTSDPRLEIIRVRSFDVATFVAFTLFPLAIVASPSFGWLLAAFVVGGLREVGEPARKALIIDLAEPEVRARVVGLYYLGRSVAIAPAAFIGGLLWKVSPVLPFYVAASAGVIGVVMFMLTVREEDAR